MEDILRRVSEDPTVLSMTHLEIVRYLLAMAQAQIEEDSIHNPSDRTLWFRVDGQLVAVEAGQSYRRQYDI